MGIGPVADGGGGVVRWVEVEHAGEVYLCDQIAIQYQQGLARKGWQQAERAACSQMVVLTQVIDLAAKAWSVAKVALNNIGKIITLTKISNDAWHYFFVTKLERINCFKHHNLGLIVSLST